MSLGVVLTTVTLSRASEACSCGGDWTTADADVVFRGKAVEVHQPLHLRHVPPRLHGVVGISWGLWFEAARKFDDDVRTVFEVETAWKGQPSQFVTVNTGSGLCCNCTLGKVFEEGKEYVVYAARYRGELGIDWCAGKAVAGKAASDAEAALLGPGTKPTPGGRSIPMFWRHLLLPSGLALPFVLGLLMYWTRTARKPSESPTS